MDVASRERFAALDIVERVSREGVADVEDMGSGQGLVGAGEAEDMMMSSLVPVIEGTTLALDALASLLVPATALMELVDAGG
jgi:hypothetical protein